MAVKKQRIPERLVDLVMTPYRNTKSRVKPLIGPLEECEIRMGVNKESIQIILLFYHCDGGGN